MCAVATIACVTTWISGRLFFICPCHTYFHAHSCEFQCIYSYTVIVTCSRGSSCVTRPMGHLLLTDLALVGTSLMVVSGPADTCPFPSAIDRGHYQAVTRTSGIEQ